MNAIEALQHVHFQPRYLETDIWRDDLVNVPDLHRDEFDNLARELDRLANTGQVNHRRIEGHTGTGKSYFLARTRKRVVKDENLFIYTELRRDSSGWADLARSTCTSLKRKHPSGRSQLQTLLSCLGESVGLCDEDLRNVVAGSLTPEAVNLFIGSFRSRFSEEPTLDVAVRTLLAILYYNSPDPMIHDLGESLILGDNPKEIEGQGFLLPRTDITHVDLVTSICALASYVGKFTVIAVDQLDGHIISQKNEGEETVLLAAESIGNWLMEVAQAVGAYRTMVIAACQADSWLLIAEKSLKSVAPRFPRQTWLETIRTPETGKAIISAYLKEGYSRAGFEPPGGTYPIKESAFATAVTLPVGRLIEIASDHIDQCIRDGEVDLLDSFIESEPEGDEDAVDLAELGGIDQSYENYLLIPLPDLTTDQAIDQCLPQLLHSGLTAWVEEQPQGDLYKVDPVPGADPDVHARLRLIDDEESEGGTFWCFRAIMGASATYALNRLRRAIQDSGIEALTETRKLVVMRNSAWSEGAKTQEVLRQFKGMHGIETDLDETDLKVFQALDRLLREKPTGLKDWLQRRRPASMTKLLGMIDIEPSDEDLPPPEFIGSPSPEPQGDDEGPSTAQGSAEEPEEQKESGYVMNPNVVPLGIAQETQEIIRIKTELLRRHVAIFAGSGSGKTVLIRRIIEECALNGVSSIVLDPNNDLSRLGIPWSEPPEGWNPGDAERSREYHENTDVVIWTPRLNSGRPLSFAPLSDLGAVTDDPDDFRLAIDNVVGMLFPRVGLPATGAKPKHGKAVLTEALTAFVQSGNNGLKNFLDYLANLPEGISQLEKGVDLAKAMAETLIAEMVTDPLFGGEGEPVDPAVLFTPKKGKRARVSVISLIGLPMDEQRQSFVNQLQLALFAWVKKHPAGDRPLGGLFVMDEAQTFAPSTGNTPCTESTLALAAQARKYGLGLIFATQAPKGLHNRIPGNASTQFYGFLNAPAQIAAAKEMAAAKGGDVSGIAQLLPGEFFLGSDAIPFQKIQVPMCLSAHPPSPLTKEDVLDLARR